MLSEKTKSLVAAAIFSSAPEANIAMGMLRANGIPCVLDGEIVNNVFGIQLAPCDGIRLMVRVCDLDLATQLLHTDGDI